MMTFNPVIYEIQRVSGRHVEAMRKYSSATICEAYGGRGALSHTIKPIKPGMKLCGPVVPVMTRPGDNLIVHKAIYAAQPQDILLVCTLNFVEAGFWGGVMTEAAMQRGIAGLVTDGSVRDSEEIIRMSFPVFSQSLCIKGTTKSCLGTVNHPMIFNEIQILPGDLILGDDDGLVVVARNDVPEVIEMTQKRVEKEQRIISALREGKTTLELFDFTNTLERIGLKEK